VTTLDKDLARAMEPRRSAPHPPARRDQDAGDAGVPVGVMTAPMIPGLNDHEMEAILEAATKAGARARLHGPALAARRSELFEEWLRANRPIARAVLSLAARCAAARSTRPSSATRMKGEGPIAQLLAARFQAAVKRLGLKGSLPARFVLRFAVPESGALRWSMPSATRAR